MAQWEAVVGLEVHVELGTASKIFCGCGTAFGKQSNSQVCPVCLGLPGARPVLNRGAVHFALAAALALECHITPKQSFERKNYFYADLPKGYQISQVFSPLGLNGYLDFAVGDQTRRVGIRQLHLEEDTGKLLHGGGIATARSTLVDFNRAGVPLVEIVTEPDLRSGEEARLFLQQLRLTMLYTGVSDCKMEEGSLRCDANVSLRPPGETGLGQKAEVKNMNSTRSVQRGIAFEIERQKDLLEEGQPVPPETRHWDEDRQLTVAMRTKHAAADYRCFSDPNVPPLAVDEGWIEEVRGALPELPREKYRRLQEDEGLPAEDAAILVNNPALARFYDEARCHYARPRVLGKWLTGEVTRVLREQQLEAGECPFSPRGLVRLLELQDDGTISGKIAKTVLETMAATGQDPDTVVQEQGLMQIADESALTSVVDGVLEANPGSVEDYRQGKKKALGFLVGQVMKETGGKANPQLVNRLLAERLG